MKRHIETLRKKEGERGFSIIEVIIAMGILVIVLVGVQSTVTAGLSQIKDYGIERSAAECARIAIEYLGTIPSDVLYDMNKTNNGNPIVGNFAGGGFPALNAFAASASGDCTKLSASSQVNLQYALCPGCVASTHVDLDTLIENTTCQYTVIASVFYTGMIYKRRHKIMYERKMYGRMTDTCENICGVGGAPSPGGYEEKVNLCDSGL